MSIHRETSFQRTARLILDEREPARMVAAGTALLLASLWCGLPAVGRRLKG